jgi:hypothetical protein
MRGETTVKAIREEEASIGGVVLDLDLEMVAALGHKKTRGSKQ